MRRRPLLIEGNEEKIGFILDSEVLNVLLTGEENLKFFYELYNGRKPKENVISSVLERIGLSTERKKKVLNYSKGMKKRLEIGRLLLYRPEALLLDEPFSGLDSGGKELLMGVLMSIKNKGTAVLIVSHEMEFALDLADRVMLMVDGRLLAQFKPEEFSRAYVVSGDGVEKLGGITLGPRSVILISPEGVDELIRRCREKGIVVEEVTPLIKAIRRES
ncbi:ATP-binding cassette domain-containing protein [Thermococcus stetteri]|uniref:ATP-binding cassette domain-containing protein n=1 Tax=Thermococcus stetteri TaxID=49900 RepID=UPI001AEA72DC|nr:ABC-type multidrug transport system ATPase subunit [Thermococcus stetteri]